MNTNKPQDITGKTFGQWTVLAFDQKKKKAYRWFCKCACGTVRSVVSAHLKNGTSSSCGHDINAKHRLVGTGIYKAWDSMKQRCLHEKHKSFKDYGARGIKICKFILESPKNLLAVIGDKPKGMSVDRINNDGHYSCGSCDECLKNGWVMNMRWATWSQQANNRRNSIKITIDGDTRSVSQWSDLSGVYRSTIYRRLKDGFSGTDLISKNHHYRSGCTVLTK